MKSYVNLESMLEEFLRIEERTIKVYDELCGMLKLIDLKEVRKYSGHYFVTNGVICVVFKGDIYLSPAPEVWEIQLKYHGFKEYTMQAILSPGVYPVEEKYARKWYRLLEEEEKRLAIIFDERCRRKAMEIGLKELPGFILAMSVRIEDEGLKTIRWYGETTYYPIIGKLDFDGIEEYLGGYNFTEKTATYIGEDGGTYIAPEIAVKYLVEAGYTKKEIPVPCIDK